MTLKVECIFDRNERTFLYRLRNFYSPSSAEESALAIRDDLLSADPKSSQQIYGVASETLRKRCKWYENIEYHAVHDLIQIKPQYTHIMYPPVLRRVSLQATEVPWHQDSGYMDALGDKGHQNVLTIFVYLSSYAADRSSLMFIEPDVEKSKLAHQTNDNSLNNQYIPEFSLPSGKQHRPKLNLGDALVFGDQTVHRSTSNAGDLERYSIEFRVSHADFIKAGRDYYSLTKAKFVKTE